jgi:acyl transferase domain-containing protein
MAAAMSEQEAAALLEETRGETSCLTVACINSPQSVTFSGPSQQLEALTVALGRRGTFYRRLRVDVPYHSSEFMAVSEDYRKRIGVLQPGHSYSTSPFMISSVTGIIVDRETLCDADYWVRNMLQPVRFSDAVFRLAGTRDPSRPIVKLLIEIGPHSTLQGPIRDTLKILPKSESVTYSSALARHVPADKSFLTTLGVLWSQGFDLNLELVNTIGRTNTDRPTALPSLPSYPFDHSCRYWPKGRLGKEFQSRRHGRLDLLGKPVLDWNPLEPRWRNFLNITELPWAQDHKVWDVFLGSENFC